MLAIRGYNLKMKFIPGQQNILSDASSTLSGHEKEDIKNKAMITA